VRVGVLVLGITNDARGVFVNTFVGETGRLVLVGGTSCRLNALLEGVSAVIVIPMRIATATSRMAKRLICFLRIRISTYVTM
jgi:hypothetical protein